jgi:diguanylate cyclase (GGDEF)-like protein
MRLRSVLIDLDWNVAAVTPLRGRTAAAGRCAMGVDYTLHWIRRAKAQRFAQTPMHEGSSAAPRDGAPTDPGPRGLAAHQVDILFEQSLWTLPAGLASALLLAALLWPVASHRAVLAWLGALAGLSAGRLLLTLDYRRRRGRGVDPRPFRRMFTAGTALSGALWAAGAIYVAPAHSLPHWGAYLLWLGGLVAGGVATLSAVMSAYLAFVLPAVVPVSAYLLVAADATGRTVGAMLLLFLAFMVIAAWRVNRAMVGALRLQFENLQLNARLRADLERHLRIEGQLRESKRRAEALARQLRQISAEDGLTGLSNRRHFDHVFLREWRRALRGRYPLSLVLLDLDFFKEFNDRYGHHSGDECLRRVASVLAGHGRRPGDLAARYGGEEFALLLASTGLGDARAMALRVVGEVQALGIVHERSTVAPVVTISAGVATLVPDRNMSAKHLIEMADAALYRAKAEGRNRVVTAEELVPDSVLRPWPGAGGPSP